MQIATCGKWRLYWTIQIYVNAKFFHYMVQIFSNKHFFFVGLQGIQKIILGITEGFPEAVVFSMNLEGQMVLFNIYLFACGTRHL